MRHLHGAYEALVTSVGLRLQKEGEKIGLGDENRKLYFSSLEDKEMMRQRRPKAERLGTTNWAEL